MWKRSVITIYIRRKIKWDFFLDTANVEEIKKANDMGVICGVTTNPSIIAKEGRDFNEVIKEIAAIVDGPISGEVKATTVDAEAWSKKGRELAKSIRIWLLSFQLLLRLEGMPGTVRWRDQNKSDIDF